LVLGSPDHGPCERSGLRAVLALQALRLEVLLYLFLLDNLVKVLVVESEDIGVVGTETESFHDNSLSLLGREGGGLVVGPPLERLLRVGGGEVLVGNVVRASLLDQDLVRLLGHVGLGGHVALGLGVLGAF